MSGHGYFVSPFRCHKKDPPHEQVGETCHGVPTTYIPVKNAGGRGTSAPSYHAQAPYRLSFMLRVAIEDEQIIRCCQRWW